MNAPSPSGDARPVRYVQGSVEIPRRTIPRHEFDRVRAAWVRWSGDLPHLPMGRWLFQHGLPGVVDAIDVVAGRGDELTTRVVERELDVAAARYARIEIGRRRGRRVRA